MIRSSTMRVATQTIVATVVALAVASACSSTRSNPEDEGSGGAAGSGQAGSGGSGPPIGFCTNQSQCCTCLIGQCDVEIGDCLAAPSCVEIAACAETCEGAACTALQCVAPALQKGDIDAVDLFSDVQLCAEGCDNCGPFKTN